MAEVLPPDNQSYFSPQNIRRSTPSPTFVIGSPNAFASELHHKLKSPQPPDDARSSHSASSASSGPASRRSSHGDLQNAAWSVATPSTTISAGTPDCDDEINYPSYNDDSSSDDRSEDLPQPQSPHDSPYVSDQTSDTVDTPTNTPELALLSLDDTHLRDHPARQVDYLSHEWREQDIWASWRYIVSQRKFYGERSRLENASWRTWAKQQHKLKTITPETLNWLKDCDVTWLYGPLQTSNRRPSELASNISKSNSFLNKKPILKKRSVSEVMLQKSLSTSSLIKQAAAVVKAQENVQGGIRLRGRPMLSGRAASDFVTSHAPSQAVSREATDWLSSKSTSGIRTPADGSEKKHIRFDEKVEQCIAVEAKEDEEEGEEVEEEEDTSAVEDGAESSSDDGGIMLKAERRRTLSRSNSRGSMSGEGRIIAMLPSTTLKYRTDSPCPPPSHSVDTSYWRAPKLSPSASQETIRPANPAANFLLPDEDDEDDFVSWEPGGAFSNRVDSLEQLDRQYSKSDSRHHPGGAEPAGGLRRTESGMLMPFGDEEEAAVNAGLFGRVMDGVNTARDIAHVIWNVGWRGSQ